MTAFDQGLQQPLRGLTVADLIDTQSLQGACDRADIAQDFLFPRTPHRLTDRPCGLEGRLRRLHDEVCQVQEKQREDDGHDQRRRDGEDAADQHEAHVKPRAGSTAPAIQP